MKIAIIGSNPHTWDKVPELGPEWHIWRFSRKNWDKPPKFTRWFELHHERNFKRYELQFPGYNEFLISDPRVVLQTGFPWADLLAEFGPYFFSGGQAPWIMAHAINWRPETIGLWGIDPVGDYKPQRSEVQHFVQVARSLGIEVIAPEDKILEHRPLYALETDTLVTFLQRLGYSEEKIDSMLSDPAQLLKRAS